MSRKLQNFLSVSASVLAISAGATVAQAAPVPGQAFPASGGSPTQWSGTYVLTDIDTTTPAVPDTLQTGNVVVGGASDFGGDVNVVTIPNGTWEWSGDLAGNADAVLTNGGTFSVRASNTLAPSGNGSVDAGAYAGKTYGSSDDQYVGAVRQTYSAGGNLNVALNNSGSLAIAADASATSKGLWAVAAADVDTGIFQRGQVGTPQITASEAVVEPATGHGDVALVVNNTGKIAVSSSAAATADTYAGAKAESFYAIGQHASNYSPAIPATKDAAAFVPVASVKLINAKGATISIATMATTNSKLAYAGEYAALAEAESIDAIDQHAKAENGQGIISLANAGNIQITSDAKAAALVGAGYASADFDQTFHQEAEAAQSAITFENAQGAAINMSAVADAAGLNLMVGGTYAYANIEEGIYQEADASSGLASVSLVNAGTLSFLADATAAYTGGRPSAEHERLCQRRG